MPGRLRLVPRGTIVPLLALILAASSAAVVVAAAPPVPGVIQINGGTPWTNQAIVTVSTPASNAVSMRLSINGTDWKTMAWAASTSWDLTDPAYGGSSVPGVRYVYVDFDDGSDTWDPAWSGGFAYVLYDIEAPVESSMRASIEPGRQVNGGRVIMRVTWFNDDHSQSGTHTYDIESRVDGGAWTPVASHPALPGIFYAIAPGHTYELRVRGIDYATNVGAWYVGPAFRVTTRQETSKQLRWKGRWTRVASAGYWGGHAKTNATAGSTSKITFNGRMVALVSRFGPKRGNLAVYVDGVKVSYISLRAPSSYRRVVWSKTWPTSGTHTVAFKITKVPGSDRAEIDAILTGS